MPEKRVKVSILLLRFSFEVVSPVFFHLLDPLHLLFDGVIRRIARMFAGHVSAQLPAVYELLLADPALMFDVQLFLLLSDLLQPLLQPLPHLPEDLLRLLVHPQLHAGQQIGQVVGAHEGDSIVSDFDWFGSVGLLELDGRLLRRVPEVEKGHLLELILPPLVVVLLLVFGGEVGVFLEDGFVRAGDDELLDYSRFGDHSVYFVQVLVDDRLHLLSLAVLLLALLCSFEGEAFDGGLRSEAAEVVVPVAEVEDIADVVQIWPDVLLEFLQGFRLFLLLIADLGEAEEEAGGLTLLIEVGHLLVGVVDVIEGIVEDVHLVLGQLLRVAIFGAMAGSALLLAILANDRHHLLNYLGAMQEKI